MASAIKNSEQLTQRANGFASENSSLQEKFNSITQIGQNLQSNVEGRLLWLEMLKAIDVAIPKDTRPEAERQETAEDVMSRREIHIEHMECEHFEDLSEWFSGVQDLYVEAQQEFVDQVEDPTGDAAAAGTGEGDLAAEDGAADDGTGDEDAALDADPAQLADAEFADEDVTDEEFADDEFADDELGDEEGGEGVAGPSGAGWVIQLNGYHFHNTDPREEAEQFVENTLVQQLEEGEVMLPDGPGGEMIPVSMKELGIGYPVIITQHAIYEVLYNPEATSEQDARRMRSRSVETRTPRNRRGRSGRNEIEEEDLPPEPWKLREYDFVLQFCWQPTTRSERQENRDGGGAEDDEAAQFAATDIE